MPGVQTLLLQRLQKVNPNVVLVVLTGSPISATWEAEHLPALLVMWYAGQEGGAALAAALAGDVSPAGRSPFTWPTGVQQLPDELDMSPSTPPGRTYRYLSQVPLYAFGFGVSYGKMSYAGATVSPSVLPAMLNQTMTVCVRVANMEGAFPSEEVVQVYATPLADVVALAASPPLKLLVAFKRIDALFPGESATVCLNVALRDMRLMGHGGARQDFRILPGRYILSVGGVPPGPLGVHVESDTVAAPLNLTIHLVEPASAGEGHLDFVV